MSTTLVAQRPKKTFGDWLVRHWFAVFVVFWGVWTLIPIAAPALMLLGMTKWASAIYFFENFFCHQLPERSLFLFGLKPMYSLAEIKSVWPLNDFLGLRQFVGNPTWGYRVAECNRTIAMNASLWLCALGWLPFRRKVKPLPWWGFVLLLLPLALDGGTHTINDVMTGMSGAGFRDTNAWLQFLTKDVFPRWFYVGDALGSFNDDMRWITGGLAGLAFPYFFRTQTLNQELDKLNYEKVIERIKNKELPSSR